MIGMRIEGFARAVGSGLAFGSSVIGLVTLGVLVVAIGSLNGQDSAGENGGQPGSAADPDHREAQAFDEAELYSGQRIEGTITELTEDGKMYYLIKRLDGTILKLDTFAVRRVVRPDQLYGRYLQRIRDLPDTADAHWDLYAWCRTNRLVRQGEYHLHKVLQHDPDDARARSLLDYREVDGRWMLDDHYFSSFGYEKYQGRWRLPDGVSYVENRKDKKESVGNWFRQLKLLRRQAEKDGLNSIQAELRSIDDPAAVEAISKMYESEENASFRLVLIEVLGNIRSSGAQQKLISAFLSDPVRRNFERALTLLQQEHFDPAATVKSVYPFMDPQPDTPVEKVRRAGYLIGEMGDETAIVHLIDGLKTVHNVPNPNAQQGNVNTGIVSGGRGNSFSMGGDEPAEVSAEISHDTVLKVLERFTGRSFGFNEQLWLDWYIKNRTLTQVDLRRDQ